MGPREHFRALFDEHAQSVLAYLPRRLSEPADAADVLAEVFVVAWRRIDEVPAGEDGRPWLFGVARLTLQNERRRQRRGRALAARLRAELGAQPDRLVLLDRSAQDVGNALNRLSVGDRELLMLVGWDGLTPAQAAVALGTSPGAVRVRLHRARQRLRLEFRGNDADLEADERRSDRTGQVVLRGATAAPPALEET